MPFLLRKVRRGRWVLAAEGTGELPAEPLTDLNAASNRLSLWLVADDGSNLLEIITALATQADEISNVDVAVFDEGLVSSFAGGIEGSSGATALVGTADFHRDLVELKAATLLDVAEVLRYQAEFKHFPRPTVRAALLDAVAAGRIEWSAMNQRLRRRLQDEGIAPA